jgi:hypothetical protein
MQDRLREKASARQELLHERMEERQEMLPRLAMRSVSCWNGSVISAKISRHWWTPGRRKRIRLFRRSRKMNSRRPMKN